MIAVSTMTLSDVIAAVEIRCGYVVTPLNTDWGTIGRYVIDARRDLFNRTNPFKEWAYQKTVQVNHLTVLPDDYIRPIRLTTKLPASADALAERYEARRVDPREWMRLSNVSAAHSFAKGWEMSGVYMVWANNTDSTQWAATPPAVWIYPNNLVGQFDYVAQFGDNDLTNYSSPVNVPVEMESLLIDMASARLLADIADPARVETLLKEVQSRLAQYQGQIIAARQAVAIEAAAIPNPEPANITSQPSTPGGLI